jgi:hypothetical protein
MDPTLRSLLIGIDYYFPNTIEGARYFPGLEGCVRDIEYIEGLLIHKMNIHQENIIKLTSSKADDDDRPSESPEKWPTYENTVAALHNILEVAKPDDQVYIHYSGMGGKTRTILPEIKGKDGLDNILVLVATSNNQTHYLRDVEIIRILKEMLDKRLVVTLVLDTSYYGHTIRGRAGADTRGLNVVHNAFHQQVSSVASIEELTQAWNFLTTQKPKTEMETNMATDWIRAPIKAKNQDITSSSGWLPNPKDYVLITACKPSESAYEYTFEKEQRNGVLTYWLVKSLEQLSRPISYKVLHDSIAAKIHGQFPMQTPMLEGERDREIFGSNTMQAIYAINVIKLDLFNQRVLLNAGQAHGIRKGMRFAIYPSSFKDFSYADRRLAFVEVDESESTSSWAKIISDFIKGSIREGTQAVLINSLDVHIKRKIRLIIRGRNQIKASTSSDPHNIQEQALNKIKNLILGKSSKPASILLELASKDYDKADFQVSINEKGEYEIWDPAGNILPNLNPPLRIDDSDSDIVLIRRLEHLVKYSNVLHLDNYDATSDLSQKLVIDLFKTPDNWEPGDRLKDLQPFESDGNVKLIKAGQRVVLRVKNTFSEDSKKVLNVTILDLQPDWGITQIYPSSPGAIFLPIDPGREEFFPLQADLPSGYKEGRDIIKVFGTTEQTNFRQLELRPMNQAFLHRHYGEGFRHRRSGLNILETLMASMIGASTSMQNVRDIDTIETKKAISWTTTQIEIQINRVATKPATVFISYAREDVDQARKLYRDLKSSGLNPRLDIEDIMPGQSWEISIKEAIRNSEYFIPLFSTNSVAKGGYVQKELKEALAILEKTRKSKFIIPVRLDDCKIPYIELMSISNIDLFPKKNWNEGIKKIVHSIKKEELQDR